MTAPAPFNNTPHTGGVSEERPATHNGPSSGLRSQSNGKVSPVINRGSWPGSLRSLGEERWQSGRMRVFAKDVSGQKLDRGFESRPLRLVKKVEANMPCFQGFLKSESLLTSVTLLINHQPRDRRGVTLLKLC